MVDFVVVQSTVRCDLQYTHTHTHTHPYHMVYLSKECNNIRAEDAE